MRNKMTTLSDYIERKERERKNVHKYKENDILTIKF